MPLLDLFQQGALQVEVAKAVMVAFNRSQTESLSDFLIVNGVMYIAKILHDSIDASTFEDEKRQISELILHFVRRVRQDRARAHGETGTVHLSPLLLCTV
jgi:hypothetical protein